MRRELKVGENERPWTWLPPLQGGRIVIMDILTGLLARLVVKLLRKRRSGSVLAAA